MFPKKAAEFIYSNSENVFIDFKNLDNLCDNLSRVFIDGAYNLKSWKQNELNPKSMNEDAISWIFFIDTINFSFWPDENQHKFSVTYKNKKYTGYWSICAAVNRAIDNGIDITNVNYMKDITIEQFNNIFYSDNGQILPLVEERVKALREAGLVLIEKFNGHFINCIIRAEKSCQNLLQIIADNFSSYQDHCLYKGQLVCLYKRAQILIADIWCCFEAEGPGEFHDIDSLTAFADYRVPQVLAYFKAIVYSDDLKAHLEKKKLLENGHPWEVEIRGVTLQCIEIMKEKLQAMLNVKKIYVNSVLIDNYLWEYRRTEEKSIDTVPMHRTRTIFY